MTYLELFDNIEQFSPMMRQYLNIKKDNLESIVLFRLGDFYEAFFDDAVVLSKTLNLYLTKRDAGNNYRATMCGVPYHALNNYLTRLIKTGLKIAIVEQVEDPSTAKGLVKREVTRYITPGTLIDIGLNEKENNYIATLSNSFIDYTLVLADLSTGELFSLFIDKNDTYLIGELLNYQIKEIVIDNLSDELVNLLYQNSFVISYEQNYTKNSKYKKVYENITNQDVLQATIRLLNYLGRSNVNQSIYFKPLIELSTNSFMKLDYQTRLNLELTRTMRKDDINNSLLFFIDNTKTALGARMLKKIITKPLRDVININKRLDAVSYLVEDYLKRTELTNYLDSIYDLERITSRINYGNTNARDCLQLQESLAKALEIKELLRDSLEFKDYLNNIADLSSIVYLIKKAINPNPPITITEGNVINDGYNDTLDQLREKINTLNNDIKSYEEDLRNSTGIKTLKISFNDASNYFIEIPKGASSKLETPPDFNKIQSLTNQERFKTNILKNLEKETLSTTNKIKTLEYELFIKIREIIKNETDKISEIASAISYIDVFNSFAVTAVKHNYCRPTFSCDHSLDIVESRHAIVEQIVGNKYVSNDYHLNSNEKIFLVTGPNMGGKSTYMRQLALIAILAQSGSFVPAKSASIPIFNRIFTRIGASDDTSSGKSTFMVEMEEVSEAIRSADSSSLLLFDEIGRGTSTYDGLALAEAILEHLVSYNKSITVFSTHYQQLTNLSSTHKEIKNIAIAAKVGKNSLEFLYKALDGVVEKSYGVEVAKMAELPDILIARAYQILNTLENSKVEIPIENLNVLNVREKEPTYISMLRELDLDSISPKESWGILEKLIYYIKNEND